MFEKIELLQKLVSFNTVNDCQNKEILNFLKSVLLELGFKTLKDDKILIMQIGDGSALGFVGHTDTVEFTAGWKTDPFVLTQVEDKLFGLGVCDMKSGIATMISAISQMDFSKMKKGMKMYFTYDEEIGFGGIKDVLAFETDYPKTIIVGEPTNNEVLVGSKGLMEFKISFTGKKAHSSNPQKGENAINKAVNFINSLNDFYNNQVVTRKNLNFNISYTTMNVGMIKGGSAINSVPDYCEFFVDFRTTDFEIQNLILKKIQFLCEKFDASFEIINKLDAFFNRVEGYTKTSDFITEASFLKNNRLILGAGPDTSHEVNESVSIESLNILERQYKDLILKYCN